MATLHRGVGPVVASLVLLLCACSKNTTPAADEFPEINWTCYRTDLLQRWMTSDPQEQAAIPSWIGCPIQVPVFKIAHTTSDGWAEVPLGWKGTGNIGRVAVFTTEPITDNTVLQQRVVQYLGVRDFHNQDGSTARLHAFRLLLPSEGPTNRPSVAQRSPSPTSQPLPASAVAEATARAREELAKIERDRAENEASFDSSSKSKNGSRQTSASTRMFEVHGTASATVDPWLALRAEPNPSQPILARLKDGTQVASAGHSSGNWVEIEVTSGSDIGKRGWVHERFLRPLTQ